MKRVLSLLLCAILILALFPAAAFARYSTVSNRGVELQYPSERDYYTHSFTAWVVASRENGSIYFMPKPKSGNGHLGTVKDGTRVTILAEKSGYFFFQTSNGNCGWNGKNWFDYDKDAVPSKVGSSSGSSGSHSSTVSTKGVELEFPASRYYFGNPFYMTVKASRSGGSIYLMPKPKSGNGNLGRVKDGEVVTILAEKGSYYFFVTDDGRYGWNGKKWFW